MKQLPEFSYDWESGPVEVERLGGAFAKGNCRLAIQLYFALRENLAIPPEKILCPESYLHLGEKVEIDATDPFGNLKSGDVVFAERIRNSKGEKIDKSRQRFDCEEGWIISLHTAVYVGQGTVWHATSIEGKTCSWPLDKFLHYYRPVLARRVKVVGNLISEIINPS